MSSPYTSDGPPACKVYTGTVLIGRDKDCDIVTSHRKTDVSRLHLVVKPQRDGFLFWCPGQRGVTAWAVTVDDMEGLGRGSRLMSGTSWRFPIGLQHSMPNQFWLQLGEDVWLYVHYEA